MDNTVIALSVALVVVLVMLWMSREDKQKSAAGLTYDVGEINYGGDDIEPSVSTFGTGLINTMARQRYKELDDLGSYEDYNSVAQFMSVEPEVFESHDRYSQDMGRSTSGPSNLSERDDRNDVVPWVGASGRPKYQDIYVGKDARVDISEVQDQMPVNSQYVIG